jgi:hypothetical protein
MGVLRPGDEDFARLISQNAVWGTRAVRVRDDDGGELGSLMQARLVVSDRELARRASNGDGFTLLRKARETDMRQRYRHTHLS